MISYLKCCLIAAIILIIYKLFNNDGNGDGGTWHKVGNKFYKIK